MEHPLMWSKILCFYTNENLVCQTCKCFWILNCLVISYLKLIQIRSWRRRRNRCKSWLVLSNKNKDFNPIQHGLWNDVVTWGVFLSPSSFGPYDLVKSHANTQNLLPNNFFNIQTSFDTTISTVKEVWPSISVHQSWSTYA